MYRHLLERLVSVCERHDNWQIRVVSQYPELLKEIKNLPVRGIFSPDSPKGASYSIRAGLCGAEAADAYAFFVADQPWLSGETAEAFLSGMEREEAPLGSVCFQGQPGNPTWFSGKFLPELLSLTGDKGGRAVLRRHEAQVRWFEVKEKKELKDLDLPNQ